MDFDSDAGRCSTTTSSKHEDLEIMRNYRVEANGA